MISSPPVFKVRRGEVSNRGLGHMRLSPLLISSVALAGLCVVLADQTALAQQRQPSQTEDVVRVSTELVQTDVTIFGKDGTFVDGLKRAMVAESSGLERKVAPDIAVQIQVLRDNEPVITSTLRKIVTAGAVDLTRLPYSAEIPLENLPPGRYLLKVSVIDRIAKTSASQQLSFQVD